jgi:group I intron endonuclease
MTGGVYQIRNTVTGATYVGSTNDFVRRKSEHFKMLRAGRHPAGHLQNSVNKHGIDAFAFDILVECSDHQLLDAEQAEIDRVIAASGRDALYNANPSAARVSWTEESKEKLRQKRVGESNPFFGQKHTPEAGAKMSASRMGRTAWNKGKTATDEHRAKIAASGVGRVQSDETRTKRAITMKRMRADGKLFGPDHIAAISAAQKLRREREKLRTDL